MTYCASSGRCRGLVIIVLVLSLGGRGSLGITLRVYIGLPDKVPQLHEPFPQKLVGLDAAALIIIDLEVFQVH